MPKVEKWSQFRTYIHIRERNYNPLSESLAKVQYKTKLAFLKQIKKCLKDNFLYFMD